MKVHLYLVIENKIACGMKKRSMNAPFDEWRKSEETKCLNCYKSALRLGLFRGNNDYTPTQAEGSLQNGNYECKAYEV